jgi:hypothetical protein
MQSRRLSRSHPRAKVGGCPIRLTVSVCPRCTVFFKGEMPLWGCSPSTYPDKHHLWTTVRIIYEGKCCYTSERDICWFNHCASRSQKDIKHTSDWVLQNTKHRELSGWKLTGYPNDSNHDRDAQFKVCVHGPLNPSAVLMCTPVPHNPFCAKFVFFTLTVWGKVKHHFL